MGVLNIGKKTEAAPYTNLTETEDREFEIVSKKEEQLKQYERVLTLLMIGALAICIGLITYLTAVIAENPTSDMSEFSSSAFSVKLYDVLKNTPGNVFFSPYSLQIALAMAYSGATGNTAAEIRKSLAFPESKDALYKAVQNSENALKANKDVHLDVANGMFVQEDYVVKDAFLNVMKNIYGAQAKNLNFGNSSAAAGEINSFVNEKTRGKITELFSSDAFNSLTRMVLVNAVYFKGIWQNQFKVEDTVEGEFYLNSKQTVQVPFMTVTANFNTAENDDLSATIIELPYKGDISMVLIVPKEIEGLKQVESKLKNLDLRTLTEAAYSKEVKLTMPKFKLEQKLNLKDPLMQLGVQEMFDLSKADFGGITDKRDLYVSQVVQKAFIEVNEEGSEAAAATGLRFVMRKMPMPPLEIHVRAPFLFLIRQAQELLFVGRVAKV